MHRYNSLQIYYAKKLCYHIQITKKKENFIVRKKNHLILTLILTFVPLELKPL